MHRHIAYFTTSLESRTWVGNVENLVFSTVFLCSGKYAFLVKVHNTFPRRLPQLEIIFHVHYAPTTHAHTHITLIEFSQASDNISFYYGTTIYLRGRVR